MQQQDVHLACTPLQRLAAYARQVAESQPQEQQQHPPDASSVASEVDDDERKLEVVQEAWPDVWATRLPGAAVGAVAASLALMVGWGLSRLTSKR